MNKRKGPAPRLYTHNGITLDLRGWAVRLGTTKEVLKSRLSRQTGWTVEQALTRPVLQKGKHPRRRKLVVISAEQIFRAWVSSPVPRA